MAIGFERFPGPRPGPRPGPHRGGGGRRGPRYFSSSYWPEYAERFVDVQVVPAPAPALPWRVLLDRKGMPAVYGSTFSEALQLAGSRAPGVRVLKAQCWDGFGWRDA